MSPGATPILIICITVSMAIVPAQGRIRGRLEEGGRGGRGEDDSILTQYRALTVRSWSRKNVLGKWLAGRLGEVLFIDFLFDQRPGWGGPGRIPSRYKDTGPCPESLPMYGHTFVPVAACFFPQYHAQPLPVGYCSTIYFFGLPDHARRSTMHKTPSVAGNRRDG